jgi:hypothetical protein
MVDIVSKVHGSTSVGMLKRREHSGATKPEVVRVRASEEKYRKALRHGVTHKRFMPDINQSVEWPNDTYTHRRLREGSVVLDLGPANVSQSEPASQPKRLEARRSASEHTKT